ncbi:MAG: hypothetical protein SGBAC_011211 [Bacillariaceae sp.]
MLPPKFSTGSERLGMPLVLGTEWGTILKLGATCNLLAFFGMVTATLALVNHDSLNVATAFARATLADNGNGTLTSVGSLEEIHLYLGLRAATFVNPNTFGTTTLPYDRFCDKSLGLDAYLRNTEDDCAVCDDTTLPRMIAILVALVAFVPTFGMDITRVYSNFDVNCQKVASSLLSLITLVGCIVAYLQFNQCLDSFFDGPIYYNSDGEATFDPQNNPNAQFLNTDGFRQVSFDWQVGYGLLGLFLAMTFKFMHFICNCCIPTPQITRDRQYQKDYEHLALESDDEEESLYGW